METRIKWGLMGLGPPRIRGPRLNVPIIMHSSAASKTRKSDGHVDAFNGFGPQPDVHPTTDDF